MTLIMSLVSLMQTVMYRKDSTSITGSGTPTSRALFAKQYTGKNKYLTLRAMKKGTDEKPEEIKQLILVDKKQVTNYKNHVAYTNEQMERTLNKLFQPGTYQKSSSNDAQF